MTEDTSHCDAEQDTDDCGTCGRSTPVRFLSGGECPRCEHIRADAREAARADAREAAERDRHPDRRPGRW